MKLRNKKTGEIDEFLFEVIKDRIDLYRRVEHSETKNIWHYNSLAELNSEWEDYEEKPKGYWFIDAYGNIVQNEITKHYGDEYIDMTAAYESQKQIGNHFETPEEAEKAMEKLKAFKRLKDKGFRFDLSPALGHCDDKKFDISIIGTMPAKWWYNDKVVDDIHYIFGGEE